MFKLISFENLLKTLLGARFLYLFWLDYGFKDEILNAASFVNQHFNQKFDFLSTSNFQELIIRIRLYAKQLAIGTITALSFNTGIIDSHILLEIFGLCAKYKFLLRVGHHLTWKKVSWVRLLIDADCSHKLFGNDGFLGFLTQMNVLLLQPPYQRIQLNANLESSQPRIEGAIIGNIKEEASFDQINIEVKGDRRSLVTHPLRILYKFHVVILQVIFHAFQKLGHH